MTEKKKKNFWAMLTGIFGIAFMILWLSNLGEMIGNIFLGIGIIFSIISLSIYLTNKQKKEEYDTDEKE